MASSSSSVIPQERYHVFLSFRGEDIRDNFASHLYAAFRKKQIYTFFDEDRLQRGEYISPALFKAIEDSKISVIIFTENYAFSTWCLDELVKILECNRTVIPVFYNVIPSDLRKQTGSIGAAFVEHEKRFRGEPEKIKSWRAALTEASKLKGWDSKNHKPESELVDGIVRDIWKKLMNDVSRSSDSEGLVGMEEHFEHINSLLSEFQFLGIWGMGGIGKTTIAEFVSKQISSQFEGHCFIKNVREEFERLGSQYLRQQLLSACIAEKINPFQILSPTVKDRIQSTKVLIVFDNVNDFKQIDDLIGGLKLHYESKVIITTRDRQVLSQLGGTEYEVKKLSDKHAFKLFSNHAFKQNPQTRELVEHAFQFISNSSSKKNTQIGGFVEFSRRIVDYVSGHPLALKMIGSSLCGKSKEEWEGALCSLKSLSHDILEILKISYSELNPVQKEIFLDIACFFKGWNYDRVKKILNSYDLSVLIDKSFITKTKWNAIEMHDLLQEMGQDMESTKMLKHRSRIWNHEDAIQVLKNNSDLEELHGLFLDLSKFIDVDLSPYAFKKMSNLKFLNFYVSRFENGVDISIIKRFNNKLQKVKYISNELRYLHWYGCPLEELPPNFSLENLVELVLPYSKLKRLWKGRKNPSQLISIDLHDSKWLTEISDLSNAIDLEVINLQNCKRLVSLHSSHQYLSKLHILGLGFSKFPRPRSLPTPLCKLKSLKKLNFSGCSNLKICDDLCFISSLEVLDLSGTDIQSLPLNLKQLLRLKVLSLIDCGKLELLPDLPPNLRKLLAMNCKELRSLPSFAGSRGVDTSELEKASSYNSFGRMINFDFVLTNCTKLNENAINDFLAVARLRFQHMATTPLRLGHHYKEFGMAEICLCLPGSEIPDWMSYQSWGSSLTIDLSRYWSSNAFIGFILCGVAEENVECRWNFFRATFYFDNGIPHAFGFSYNVSLGSDHLFLMYCPYLLDWIIGGKYHTLIIEFEVDGDSGGQYYHLGKIKCCGACPVFFDSMKAQPNIFIKNEDFNELVISETKTVLHSLPKCKFNEVSIDRFESPDEDNFVELTEL